MQISKRSLGFLQLSFGHESPNIGRLLLDSVSVPDASVTSQCSMKVPSFILTMSTTMSAEPSPFEYRLWTITRSPSAMMMP